MTRGNSFNHRLLRRAFAALVLACALAPGTALARSSPGAGDLSPRLDELSQPSLRTAPLEEQAEQLSLAAEGPGSLLRRGNRVLANVRFDGGAEAAVASLREAGAQIVHVSPRYRTVTAALIPAALPAVAGLGKVAGVTEVLAPFTAAAGCTGSVVSEGDAQLNAAGARAAFGVDGSGVTVGILSDSFDQNPGAATHAPGDVAGGDLPGPGNPCGHPTPVNVLENFAPLEPGKPPGDEGRAMAQIVHDLAPGSALAFASAFNGELDFAANIRRLAAPTGLGGAGAKVIVDDVSYFEEPFFQDGPVAVAANEVAAGGVSYFSAAGNDNLIDAGGHDIASWEAPAFRPAGGCPAALVIAAGLSAPGDCMDFDPGAGNDQTFGITVAKDRTLTVDLQWAEPWNGVRSDLDAYLLDSTGAPLEFENEKAEKFLVGEGSDNVGVSQKPVEIFQWKNDTGASQDVQLAIDRCAGACNPNPKVDPTATPAVKVALLQNGSGVTATEYPQSSGGDVVGPNVFGHAGAAGAIAVGAVRYSDSTKAEAYSSRGPVTHRFGPVSGSSPAPAIAKQTISKPDLAATDCGVTTFFFFFSKAEGLWRFCGTSAAAPHAAAVAALMRQVNPGASADQVRAALAATASPVGAMGPNVVGAGLVSAYPAVDSLALPPTVTITRAPERLSRTRQPTIQFSANRPVAFTCEVDGSAQPCASPFTVPVALADGNHGVVVRGTDVSGRVGGTAVVPFAIDTRAPRTFFAKHPRKLIRTHRRKVKATFRFGSNEAGVAFICKVDRDLLRFCTRKISRRLEEGRHVVVVKARDAAGNVDASPAVFKFRVKRVGR